MENKTFEVLSCTCNYRKNPLGIDTEPVFSWKMISMLAGDSQSARRIKVATSPELLLQNNPDMWDSGWVEGANNLCVPYEGKNLSPRTRYYWCATARNSQGAEAQGPMSWFETAKLGEKWNGRWISAPWAKLDRTDEAAPYMRKCFKISGKVRQARLYICGLGLYEAYIEGYAVSDTLLEPAYTKYDVLALYRVYDVTSLLPADGYATLGVILGNGWYNCFTKDAWNSPQATWRGIPKLLCELHIEYLDGTSFCVYSDDTWRVSKGPILFNAIRSGESYDARLELPHWSESCFDDNKWDNVIRMRGPGGILRVDEMDPIRVAKVFKPVKVYPTEEKHRIFDMGQNFAGKARLYAYGPAGLHFILRYAEEMTPDKQHVDQSHLSCFIKEGEFQTEHYIKRSDQMEEWSSHFTYHGFRYVEVECVNGQLGETNVEGLVMHTDFAKTGSFYCSDERLNTIQHMSNWATLSNSMGIPTDSPHREKNAWTGDSGAACEQMLINYDTVPFFMKWLDDVCACQRADGSIPCVCPSTGWGYNWGNGPDWSMVLTALPWRLYQQTGNVKILERYYPYVCRHFDFMCSMAVDDIVDYGIGDWCAPFDGAAISVNMESFKAPVALTDTSFYYESARLLSNMSQVLGYEDIYKPIQKRIGEAMVCHFVGNDLSIAGDCQTSDGCIVWNHLLTPDQEEKVARRLALRIENSDWHLDFGILGSKFVMDSLGEHGYTDVLYHMLCQDTYPGYLYLARNGCTTLAECWNLGGSHNHNMFSHVSAVLYRYIAGLRFNQKKAGLKFYDIAPSLLTDTMDCSFDSPHGRASICWERTYNIVNITITLPFGTSGNLYVPACVQEGKQCIPLKSGIHQYYWHMVG